MVQNKPGEVQRRLLFDRSTSTSVVAQGKLVDVLHGYLSPGGDPATLITIDFRFLSPKSRIRSATIKLRFADSNSQRNVDPEVLGIAPKGQVSVVSTAQCK
jgi:hypothetical protein